MRGRSLIVLNASIYEKSRTPLFSSAILGPLIHKLPADIRNEEVKLSRDLRRERALITRAYLRIANFIRLIYIFFYLKFKDIFFEASGKSQVN